MRGLQQQTFRWKKIPITQEWASKHFRELVWLHRVIKKAYIDDQEWEIQKWDFFPVSDQKADIGEQGNNIDSTGNSEVPSISGLRDSEDHRSIHHYSNDWKDKRAFVHLKLITN